MRANHDTWMAAAFLLFCMFAAWQIAHLPSGVGGHATLSPAFFPSVMTGSVALLSLALLARSLWRGLAGKSVTLVQTSALKHLMAFVGLLIAYAMIYEKLGFLLSTALVMVTGMLILGERRPMQVLFWPTVLLGLAWVGFTQIMQVQLPSFNLW